MLCNYNELVVDAKGILIDSRLIIETRFFELMTAQKAKYKKNLRSKLTDAWVSRQEA